MAWRRETGTDTEWTAGHLKMPTGEDTGPCRSTVGDALCRRSLEWIALVRSLMACSAIERAQGSKAVWVRGYQDGCQGGEDGEVEEGEDGKEGRRFAVEPCKRVIWRDAALAELGR